jgi:WD40 repeat protein
MKEKTTTQARAALRLAVAAAPDLIVAGGGGASAVAPAFSPDGRFLVTGSQRDPTLWNVATGRRVATLRTDGLAEPVVFSPDGRLAVGVGIDWSSATVWAIPSGKAVKQLEFTDSPANLDAELPDLVFSPKGELLAGSTAAATDVWSTRTWKLVRRLPHEMLLGERGLAAFSPSGDRLALEHGDFTPANTLVVRDTRTWAAVDTIPAPKRAKSIDSFAFGPDGTLAIASNDYISDDGLSSSPVTRLTVRSKAGTLLPRVIKLSGLWSSPTFNADGSLLALFGNADVNGVGHTAVLRTRDWKLVASRAARGFDAAWRRGAAASGDGTTDVVDLATDVRVAALGRVSHVTLSPRTNAVAAVGADGRVRLWRNVAPAVWGPRGTAPFARSNFIARGDFKLDYPYVAVAAFSPDRRTVALDRGGWTDQLELWHARTRRAVFPHLDSFPYDVALSPDGRFVTTGRSVEHCARRKCRTGPLEVWDTRTRDRVAIVRNASVATWSPGGRWMAASPSTGAWHVRGVRVYDSRTWDVVAARPTLTGASFTSGGHVVSSSPGDTVIWSPADGTTSAHLTGSPASVDAPPSDLIATYDGNRLFVWDGSAAAVSELRVGPHVDAVALRGRLAATQKDARTTVWDTKRAHRLASLSGTIADISPDGRFVLTLAAGGEARVWDSETREIVLDLSRPGLIQHAVFGPKGRAIVAVGSDAVVRTFGCAACAGVDDLMRLAAARLRSR